jgi:UDP-MurNAc hydroxylase
MMELKFINHASIMFSKDEVNLITDPWIEGKAFQNGWSLLSKTAFSYSDFKKVTHIWFSHEHPDHFSPPNLTSIPLEFRKKITVLFHYTQDKKVIKFCEKLEFKQVIELLPNKTFELGPDFKIINTPFGHDSWLHIEADELTYLNTNDCIINTKEKAGDILKTIGEVDVLLTQFSYASKHGNANQPEKRQQAGKEKYHQMKVQMETFKPKYFIPIASYIWFSHEENFYMNDHINTIDRVESFITDSKVTPVILYPGDTYRIGMPHNNDNNIKKYLTDLTNAKLENTTKTQPIDLKRIKESADTLINRLRKEDLLAFLLISFFPIKIYLTDLDKVVKFSALFGFSEVPSNKEKINISITSEVLDHCFRYEWGFGATIINGRVQTISEKDLTIFRYYVSAASSVTYKDSTMSRVLNKLIRNIKSILNKS